MHSEIRTITPEEASKLLAGNRNNRTIRPTRIAFFEGQLKRGEMQLTHQGVAVSPSGRLLDGQHRLIACVNTGIPLMTMVTWDVPQEAFAVLDSGCARTAGDALRANDAPSAITASAAIRLWIYYTQIPGLVWVGNTCSSLVSTSVIIDTYSQDPEAWNWASTTASSLSMTRYVAPAPAACLLYLATTEAGFGRGFMRSFLAQVREGADLPNGSPILAYRNRVITGLLQKRQGQQRLADYIKVLNAYATGQSLKIFKQQVFPPMPVIISADEAIIEGASE